MPRRRSVKTADWVGLGQVAGILVVCAGLWIGYRVRKSSQEDWQHVEDWLQQYNLIQYKHVLYEHGTASTLFLKLARCFVKKKNWQMSRLKTYHRSCTYLNEIDLSEHEIVNIFEWMSMGIDFRFILHVLNEESAWFQWQIPFNDTSPACILVWPYVLIKRHTGLQDVIVG